MDKVKQIILDCLPSSAKNEIERITERLEDKGVDCYKDLQYIKFDEDFTDILKDVPARKLKAKVEALFSGNSQLSGTSAAESSQACEPYQLSDKTNLNTWLEYKVPVKKFAQETTQKLSNNERLTPSEYREVIRVVASDVMFIEKKPIKKQLEIVAEKFIQQFPVMQDCIDDIIIASGHEGFLRKLIARVENVRRPSANSLKRKSSKMLVSDNFSCPNFLPDIAVNEKSLIEKRELLKMEYLSENWKLNSVSQLMEETFPLQRLSISQKMPMSQIKDDWPYLFYSKTMIEHFNTLMKKDVVSEYEGIFCNKIPELYAFVEQQDLKTKIVFEKNQNNFLAILCAYFEEDITLILNIFDKDESLLDLKEKSLPATPFIAAFGNPYEMKDNCALIIENTGASEFINIKDASLLWFTSFYVFNLEYPIGCPATAEFIQRVCFGINPEKGTKSPKRSTRSRVNVKVQRLVEKLCFFKSMWNI